MPYSLDKAVRDDSVTITLFPQEKARALILALRIGRMSGRVEETGPTLFDADRNYHMNAALAQPSSDASRKRAHSNSP
jgi:hypothetical protein